MLINSRARISPWLFIKRDPRELVKEGNRRRLAIRIKNDSCRALLQFKDAVELLLVAWRPDDTALKYLTRWLSGRKALIFRSTAIRKASFLHILSTCALNDNLLSISKPNKAALSTLRRVLSLSVLTESSQFRCDLSLFPVIVRTLVLSWAVCWRWSRLEFLWQIYLVTGLDGPSFSHLPKPTQSYHLRKDLQLHWHVGANR